MSDNFILNLMNEVSYGSNYLLNYVSGCIIMTKVNRTVVGHKQLPDICHVCMSFLSFLFLWKIEKLALCRSLFKRSRIDKCVHWFNCLSQISRPTINNFIGSTVSISCPTINNFRGSTYAVVCKWSTLSFM